jgi:hypothetical protein
MARLTSFWEQCDVVEASAARAPDRRLLTLIEEYERPWQVRILDLGGAGATRCFGFSRSVGVLATSARPWGCGRK